MARGASLKTGNRRAKQRQRKLDLYETPPEAVAALRAKESLPQVIWEPACGPGAIVMALRGVGHAVVASDVKDWSCPGSQVLDFLKVKEAPFVCDCILTNPPFYAAEAFVAKARELAPKIIMLLRLHFLESEKRTAILEGGDLARIYVFRKRLPMMHRHGWKGRKASSAMAFAWFVWDRSHKGAPQIERISWEAV